VPRPRPLGMEEWLVRRRDTCRRHRRRRAAGRPHAQPRHATDASTHGQPGGRAKQVPVADADAAELLAAVSATARSGGFPSLASAQGRAAEVNYLRVAVVARRPGQGRAGVAGDGDGRAAAVGNRGGP
jgi:hypothetical protein